MEISYEVQRELIDVGVALLESRPQWAWSYLCEVYNRILSLRGYLREHSDIARALAAGPDIGDGLGPAERFNQRFRIRKIGSQAPVDLAEEHAELWLREWEEKKIETSVIVAELCAPKGSREDMALYARFAALAKRMPRENEATILESFRAFMQKANGALLAKWLHQVVRPHLSGNETTSEAFRQGWRKALGDPTAKVVPSSIRMLVNCWKKSEMSTDLIPELLQDVPLDAAIWLDSARFRPVLGRGLLAKIQTAQDAVDLLLASPYRWSKKELKTITSQLMVVGDAERGWPAVLDIALSLSEIAILPDLLEAMSSPPIWLSEQTTLDEIEELVTRTVYQVRDPKIRVLGLKAWKESARLDHLIAPPNPQVAGPALETEKDKSCRVAWIELLAEQPPEENIEELLELLWKRMGEEENSGAFDKARELPLPLCRAPLSRRFAMADRNPKHRAALQCALQQLHKSSESSEAS